MTSLYTSRTLGTIVLSDAQRALRALRPCFRSITLPLRFVEVPQHSVHCASSLHMPLAVARSIPVYARSRRLIA